MGRRTVTGWIFLFLLTCPVLAPAQGPPGAKAETVTQVIALDGTSFSGRLENIDDDRAVFRAGGRTRTLPRDRLWLVRLGPSGDLFARVGQRVIVLAGEGVLGVSDLVVGDGKISLQSDLLGAATLDVAAARVMYLPADDERPATLRRRHEQLKLPRAARDYLIARDKKGNLVPFPGVLKAIAADKVSFELNKADRTIDLSAVCVIELAPVRREAKSPRGYLVGRNGSTVPFQSLRLAGERLWLAGDGLKADSANLSAVAEIRFLSDRFVYLADLEPAKVVQAGTFDVVFPYRRNGSAAGGPIRLGGAAYVRGLGLHSRCELVYDLGAKFATFVARAGIDAAGGKRGNAALKILGDGKDLIKPLSLVGGAEPVEVRCSLLGVRQLTILADYGDDGIDVGDHVDLAEARLIKP